MNVKAKTKKQLMYTTYSDLVDFMYWTGKSMNNLLSYCGLVDAKKEASDKDLPVPADVLLPTCIFTKVCLNSTDW